MIDTHAHLYLKDFKADLPHVIDEFKAQAVEHVYLPNIDHTTIDDMLELEHAHPDTFTAMMGLHPCSVKRGFERDLYEVETWLQKRSFVAVGEMGIDLYWDKSTFEYQKEAFTIQTKWAHQRNLPIIIHCRESLDETLEILESLALPGLKGIFHCFTGDFSQAQRIIKLGFLMGIGGVVTFKNAGLDKTVAELDLQHLVLETDSPYLAPVPFRGKRNQPAYLTHIAQKLADVKDQPLKKIQTTTTKNAQTLFNP